MPYVQSAVFAHNLMRLVRLHPKPARPSRRNPAQAATAGRSRPEPANSNFLPAGRPPVGYFVVARPKPFFVKFRTYRQERAITIDGALTEAWASERLAVLLGSLVKRRAIHLRANQSSVAYITCIIGLLNSADEIFAPCIRITASDEPRWKWPRLARQSVCTLREISGHIGKF